MRHLSRILKFMNKFFKEFNTLSYVIRNSDSILLFPHTRPDGDAVGSVLAFKEYLKSLGKTVDVACFDPMPDYLRQITDETFEFPAHLDLGKYKLIIACDSVQRGFEKILPQVKENQVVALIDHHPDIAIEKDINIIDAEKSSTCEIIYEFFLSQKIEINKTMATMLLLGILGDTGTFQHSNTTSRVMEIASELMKKGAPLNKIISTTFTNKNISTLKLWGRAFDKAKINPDNGMIVSVLTLKDLEECDASNDDIAQVASILNTVPGTKFSLILSERPGGIVKGSLRSEEYKNTDVSKIAAQFGGGGHKLASGFEVPGKIVETETGWTVE